LLITAWKVAAAPAIVVQLRVEERTIIVLETRRIRGTRAAAPPA